jgi:F-type H+-transporting ATPase subunit delta
MGKRAAKRYAKALLNIGQEKKTVDKLLNDLQLIESTIIKNSELRSIINSPVIKNQDKLAIVNLIFKKVEPVLHNLFSTLADNNRFNHLKWICKSYTIIYHELHHIRETHIKSAVPLDDSVIETLRQKVKTITGDEAIITTTVDEDLIGGFILNLRDLQYDTSISGRIHKLKHNLQLR